MNDVLSVFFSFYRSQDDNKSRFEKTKSLRDKFRGSKTWSLRRSVEKESSPVTTTNPNCDKNGNSSQENNTGTTSTYAGQLSRLFSLRRSLSGVPGGSNSGPLSDPTPPKASMPCVAEEDEQMVGGPLPTRRYQPPSLPQAPLNLTPAQMKRRHIVSSLVHR